MWHVHDETLAYLSPFCIHPVVTFIPWAPFKFQGVMSTESKPAYVQLTKEKSAKLFELITGKKASRVC